ncbi:hypothetical protein GOBAR_AA13126 [Gossypium barbadense]|uniref:SWIM-type domain-containing protein n=1 Tax=Gossypium barbadense TaxID=3634 RepID=A0A2P5XW17_GOSBA|nr:hypothetical protein GOBAR_AA13126 [Gossypium barbadense]
MTNNGEDSDQDVEDFSDPDVDEVSDDIDDEGPEEVEDVHGPSFCNPSHAIILRNKLGGNMLNVDPDAAHASEFPEYADIEPAHRLTSNSQFDELFVGQQFKNKADCVFAIKQYSMKLLIDYKVAKSTPTLYVGECWRADDECGWRVRTAFIQRIQQWKIRKLEGRHTCTVARMSQDHRKLDAKRYELEPHQFRHKLARLATLMPKIGLKQVKQLEAGHVYVEKIRDAMKDNTQRARLMNVELYSRNLETFRVTKYISRPSGIPLRSYRVDLRNRRCECGMFQALQYPCAHVVVACATYSLNVEQYIDNVYTLERTLRIWVNKFPVLRDISTWEVQSLALEMLPTRSLRRRVKGRTTITRIRNDMDVREQVDPKRCTICRTIGHNWSKCPHRNVYTGQYSRSKRK